MAADVIGLKKRKLLLACALLLTLAVGGFAAIRFPEVYGFIAMASLSAAVYSLCIVVSRYKPPIVIAFVGLLLNLLLVLDTAAPSKAGGADASATGAAVTAGEAVGSAISTMYGQILLLIMSFFLLVAVLMQRRWAPIAESR